MLLITCRDVVNAIIKKIGIKNKPRMNFMLHLFELFLGMRGRYNFLNFSRYGDYHEQTYRNQFSQPFNFIGFNQTLIEQSCSREIILAFDPCHISKSGKHTDHLGTFWSGVNNKAMKGLEIGGIAVVDVENNTAMSVEAVQTPSPKTLKLQNKTLVEHYAEVLIERKDVLTQLSSHLAADGYFAKDKFINALIKQVGIHLISKLRTDANLRYLYKGPHQKRKGAPKKFDGKINLQQIDKKHLKADYEDQQCKVYSGLVWSVLLKRKIKLAYVEIWKDNRFTGHYAVLFSTDLALDGYTIYKYYKSRFQIEFLYRDAKQFVGLNHCQARSEKKLHFHFNACLTTVSLAKAIYYLPIPKKERKTFSMEDIKTMHANNILAKRIFYNLELNLSCKKINEIYLDAIFFGRKAA
jgi:hypothetical protein